MEKINFNGKTMTELKAHAYDVLASIQQGQQVLNAINEEIAKRAQAEGRAAVNKQEAFMPGRPVIGEQVESQTAKENSIQQRKDKEVYDLQKKDPS